MSPGQREKAAEVLLQAMLQAGVPPEDALLAASALVREAVEAGLAGDGDTISGQAELAGLAGDGGPQEASGTGAG